MKEEKNLLLSTISFFEQNQTGQTPQSRSRPLCFRHGCLAASAERSHSLVNNYTLHHMLPPLRKKVAREKSSFRTQISAGVGSHQTHMMECRSAPFHNLSGETPGRPRDRSRLALRCVHPELRGPMFGMISPLCCMSSAWICPHRVCERNNVRVWGRRSAFWEYLWCFSSTLAFSSPNSPHSSAKDNTPFLSTRCAKKNGGGGRIASSHTSFDPAAHQHVCKPPLCVSLSATAGSVITEGGKNQLFYENCLWPENPPSTLPVVFH